MKIENLNISKSIENLKQLLSEEKNISPVMRAAIEMILVIVSLLAGRALLNSSNSSKPPSSDPNRKKPKKETSGKKQGGQLGRIGKNLVPIETPDEVVEIPIDRSKLNEGEYKEADYEARQVFDIKISLYVTE